MNIIYYKKPWNHAVIDNFFTDDLLDYANDLASNVIKGYNVFRIDDKVLSDYFRESFKTKSLKHILEFNLMKPKYDYPIHDEAHWKKLSVVVYIKPEVGNGTYLYDKDQKIAKQVEWKINRAFVLKGIPNTTWHSYGHWDKTTRITVNFFQKYW